MMDNIPPDKKGHYIIEQAAFIAAFLLAGDSILKIQVNDV